MNTKEINIMINQDNNIKQIEDNLMIMKMIDLQDI